MAGSPSKEMEDYWNEFKTIEQSDAHSDEDELSKTPDGKDQLLCIAGYVSMYLLPSVHL